MAKWKRIESAPKDETEILVAGWVSNDPTTQEMWVSSAIWNDGIWWHSEEVGLYPPTHWRPMPKPPM